MSLPGRVVRGAAIALIAILGSPVACAEAQPGGAAETVVTGLEFPAGIAFASSGRMFVNERAGAIRIVEQGRLDPQPVATIPTTTTAENGLLGIAVSPDEDSLYVFATAPEGDTNRVLRVHIGGGTPDVVVDGLPAGGYHNGGGVAFSPDGMLLVSHGEQHSGEQAQDPEVTGGKVYRFTPQGDVPSDNPFAGTPAFAIGLRNPYGLAVDPISGLPFVTENGPESHDEINRVTPGANLGWPIVSGPSSGDTGALPGAYSDPLLDYPEVVVPTGIAFADPKRAARPYRGDLFFATYGESSIHRVRLDARRRTAVSDEIFYRAEEPVVALAWGPRGLYFSTSSSVNVIPIAARSRVQGTGDQDPGDQNTVRDPESMEQRAPSEDPEGGGDQGTSPVTIALIVAGVAAAVVALLLVVKRYR